MFRLTLKNLWAHKVRFALTGVAVVLGVAFMAGTMVLTDTMGRTFDNMFAVGNAGTDVIVQQPETVDTDWGDTRERVPTAAVDTISSVDGVDVAVGSIQGFSQLVKADGTVGTLDGLGVTIGANWIDDENLNPFRIDSGRPPAAPGEAVVDRKTIEDNGWSLGDQVSVIAKGAPQSLTLVGTAMYGELSGMPGSSTLVAVDDATAQQLFAGAGVLRRGVGQRCRGHRQRRSCPLGSTRPSAREPTRCRPASRTPSPSRSSSARTCHSSTPS